VSDHSLKQERRKPTNHVSVEPGPAQYSWKGGSIRTAVGAAAFFGLFFGCVMALVMRGRLRGFLKLDRMDRVTVATAVGEGRGVADPELAPALIEYAAAVRKGQGGEGAVRATTWGFGGLSVLIAVGNAAAGHDRPAAVFLALSVWWGVRAIRLPVRRQRVISNAESAESATRQQRNTFGVQEPEDEPDR
jgi:hypothetical protein